MVARVKAPKAAEKKMAAVKPKAKGKGKLPPGLAAYMSKKNAKKA
jgi:hypothetical protein